MTKTEFAVRLKNACAAVAAAEGELTEIDSHFGDADHGLTMSKIARAIDQAVDQADGGIQSMLDDAAMAVMTLNGGSAVPLWNTWLDGMQEAAPAGDEIDVDGHLVISKDLADADRVTIVTYGGSGHEPAQAGFVGKGMLDVQAVGDIFAAPNGQLVFDAMKLADKGHGVMSYIPGATFANAFLSEGVYCVIGLAFGFVTIAFRGWYEKKYVNS